MPHGETYPTFSDLERNVINSGTAGIPRWAACMQGADGRSVAVMGTGDAAALFAGIALEPIVSG
ncbi:MAG: hypothetical protein U5N21_10715 [Rhodococcus sp. (in: high G+C Gram-positive bacteria)]|uniref:hypothetical protein n=1 Tax=Rhodococcus sp. TaxID=1831 RepID=UPI002ADB5657|nr:hypothetical protein [Rhodococcus sp. (in: high G+C Gram-positive bacteria)]MDZ7930488.1 hypothetical protein [Rhodococcus sp. (in: high G+C Gram-positive bacteria)]